MTYLLIPILLASILSFLFLKKKKSRNKTSIAFKGFTFLWVNMVFLLLFYLTPELVRTGYAFITYPRYEAEIIDLKSESSWINRSGSRRRVLMYTPIVSFKPKNSTAHLKMPLDIASSERPEIGSIREVAYKNNVIYEISKKGYLFLAGTVLLCILLFYPILYLIFVIIGKDTGYLKKTGVKGFVYFALLGIITFAIILFNGIKG